MKIIPAAVASLLIITSLLAGAAFSAEGQGPRIYVPEGRFDFGTVQQGAHPEHIFEIKNVGDEVLEIRQVQPT